MQVIIYAINNAVAVTYPAKDSTENLDEIARMVVPDGMKWWIAESDDFPVQPQESWVISEEGEISVDPEKLQAINAAANEQKKNELLTNAKNVINFWQTELLLGIISDDDKSSLIAWMNYIKAVQAVKTSSPTISWPVTPSA